MIKRGEIASLLLGGAMLVTGTVLVVFRRRGAALGDARLAPEPDRPPYGSLGQAAPAQRCAQVAQGRNIRLCMQKLGPPGPAVRMPLDACSYLRNLGNLDREHFYALHLDVRNRIIGTEEVSRGSLTGVEVHPREVFKAAILNNAAGMIIAHNHPSGDVNPSEQDIQLTRTLVAGGKLLGIKVMDHVIVTDRDCRSIDDRVSFAGQQRKENLSTRAGQR